MKTNGNKIIKINDKEYQILCSICEKVSVIFKVGEFFGKKGLIYSGIVHKTVLDLDYADIIFKLLDQGKISEIHSILKKTALPNIEDGIDAYCPVCDKIYCKEHYQTIEHWDNGFFDYMEGVCPEGHKRIIDD
ncbi:MAG: hypothetical protein ACTSWR_10930 [Candidatus Helarchaeota archaeon]